MKDAMLANLDRAFRYARHLLGDAERAEDAVQEACLRCLRRSGPETDEGAARAYFLKVVRSAALDIAESESARARREEARMAADYRETVRPDEAAARNELLQALRRELALLPRELREPVVLCCQEGLSQTETAEILGVPQNTVFRRLQRGLDRLRHALTAGGFAAAAPATLAAELAGDVESAPSSLVSRVRRIMDGQGAAVGATGAAGASVAAPAGKGGLIVKIGIGVIAAGLAAGVTFWAVDGKSGEPANTPDTKAAVAAEGKQGEKKSRFDTPIWDPGAEWECAGRYLAPPHGTSAAWLDGPRNEILIRNTVYPWASWNGGEESCSWGCLDERTDQFHTVAGAGAFGYLDGPFSRARHSGNSYAIRWTGAGSPDRRYSVISDPYCGGMVRCLDFKKQEVRTLRWEGNQSISGLVFNKAGHLYVITPPDRLLVLNLENDQVVKTMTLEMRPAEGVKLQGWPISLALDEKRNRLYTCGNYSPATKWRVWYWDLEANGAFHGEAAAVDKMPASYTGKGGNGPFPVQTGSYKDGWYAYPEGSIRFGPDDPDYRFLYSSRVDTANFFRLDLEKKELAAFSGPAPGSKTVKFVGAGGTTYPFEAHVMASWLENGDFVIPVGGSNRRGLYLYRRVK